MRWACVDDLKNYIKRNKYFSDFTEPEKQEILRNLGILTLSSEGNQDAPVGLTYNSLKTKITTNALITGTRYIIEDFYAGPLLVVANNVNTLEPRAILILHPDYYIEYNANTNTITYLRDSNGNSAYYDFKNITFTRNGKQYYTFSYIDNGIIKDASNLTTVHDNKLGRGCTNNVFIGDTYYNIFEADCSNNTFESGCNDCHFMWESTNNTFKEKVVNLTGSIANKTINTGNDVLSSTITKTIHTTQNNEYVVSYLDLITYAYQILII